MAEGHGGSAQTLRDYWSGHGHPGPSHGAERDAIGWGTPGDFMRCVAQVTEHGHMTDEQAKGYCNLRHHDALGYYPATHARMEGKAAQGTAESRVPPGKTTGGQFTVGGDGPSTAPKKPNPFAGGKKQPTGARPGGKPGTKKPKSRAAIRAKIAGLQHKLTGLLELERQLKKGPVSGAPRQSTGTGTKKPQGTTSSAQQGASTTGGHSSTAAGTSKLAQVQAKIKAIRAQIAQLKAQLKTAPKSVEATVMKSSRNPRDNPTGRFRTFEGENKEAGRAFQEGRMHDTIDLLGSARALAPSPGHRTVLDQMSRSLARVQHVIPDVTKAGPHGYVHGWIKVGSSDESRTGHIRAESDGTHSVKPAGGYGSSPVRDTGPFTTTEDHAKALSAKPVKGDSLTAIKSGRTVSGFHDGSAGKGSIHLRDTHGNRTRVRIDQARRATTEEHQKILHGGSVVVPNQREQLAQYQAERAKQPDPAPDVNPATGRLRSDERRNAG